MSNTSKDTEYAQALAEGYVTARPRRIFGIRYAAMVHRSPVIGWEMAFIELTAEEQAGLDEATRRAKSWWCLWRLEALDVDPEEATHDDVSRAEHRLLAASLAKRGRTLH